MLFRKQHAKIGLGAPKIIILISKIRKNKERIKNKESSGVPKKFGDVKLEVLLHEDLCQTLAELAESLGVDCITILKRLKVLGMFQKQGH